MDGKTTELKELCECGTFSLEKAIVSYHKRTIISESA